MEISNVVAIILPACLVAGGLLLGVGLRRTMTSRLTLDTGTGFNTDDVIVSTLKGPVVLWGAMLGLYVAAQVSDLSTRLADGVQQALLVLLVISVTWAVARLAGEMIGKRARKTDQALHSPQLVTNLVRVLVVILGGLIVLQTLGIAITPLVTALGVTGLAVGLALQDTLANLFAGIHILVSRQVRQGDFIRLADGQEGIVKDITWRYTTIKQLSNITTVPNSKLASAITANFTLRGGDQSILIPASVSYGADLVQVERIARDVAAEVMREVTGAARNFDPVFRFLALDDVRIRFSVILGGRDREAQYLLRHEFIKRLRTRFLAENIV